MTTLLLGVALTYAGAAEAKSIKHDVPPAALATYCEEHGVGSETTASITLADGTTLTGTVHCEAEDLVAGDDNPGVHDANDDHGRHHEAEAGDDHGSGHEAGDDHGGHGGDHSGSDDHGGHGGDDGGSDDHGGHGGESGHGGHGGDD